MDIKDLKTLIKLVTDTDITEFEMESEDEKIVIKRGRGQEVVHMAAPPAYAASPQPAQAAAPIENAETPAPTVEDKFETITSPIVGTFYRSPSPDSDPYVESGSVVESGDVLCIVEAMKLMNEIEAEFKCRIIEILKENAEPVEFGEAVFRVERL